MATYAEKATAIFRDGGELSNVIGKGYHYEPSQEDYAHAIAQAIDRIAIQPAGMGAVLPIEGETGTGKTLGYLVPIMLHLSKTGKRALVATNTRQLQSQMRDKDIIVAQNILSSLGMKPVKVAVRRGMTAFISYDKVSRYDAKSPEGETFKEWVETKHADGELAEFADWYEQADLLPDGLKSVEIELAPYDDEAELQLFYEHQQEAQRAQLVISTHHLALSQANYRGELYNQPDDNIPPFDIVLFDEADRVPDLALELSKQTSALSTLDTILTIGRKPTAAGKVAELSNLLERHVKCGEEHLAEARSNLSPAQMEKVTDLVAYVRKGLDDIAGSQKVDDHLQYDAQRHAQMLSRFLSAISPGANHSTLGCFQESPHKGLWSLVAANKNAGQLLRRFFSDHKQNQLAKLTIFTSATLEGGRAKNELFTQFRRETGISTAEQFESVIAHKDLIRSVSPRKFGSLDIRLPNQGFVHPQDITKPNSNYEDWMKQTQEILIRVANDNPNDRLLVLTISNKEANRLGDALMGLGRKVITPQQFPTLKQGQVEFEATPDSIFITAKGWEGLDMPGKIDHLIIPRLPFKPPHSTQYEILRTDLAQAGYDAKTAEGIIRGRSLNEMKRKLRQGVGRAIRSKTDKATLWLLDPRFPVPEKYRDWPQNKSVVSHLTEVVPARFWKQRGRKVQVIHKDN